MSAEPPKSVRDLADGADVLRRLERLETLFNRLSSEVLLMPSPEPYIVNREPVLEVKCSGPEDTTESTPSPSPPGPDGKAEAMQDIVAPTSTAERDYFGPPVIEFPESVYSDFVVTCARGRPWKICTSLMVLVICLIVQTAFTAMVAIVSVDGVTAMTSHQTPRGKTINLYDKWVETLDPEPEYFGTKYNEQGLICHGLDWSWEAEMAGAMSDYASRSWVSGGSMPDGRFFGYAAITLWIGYCFQELYAIAIFLCLLFIPPPVDGGHGYVYDRIAGIGRIRGLTKLARVAILLVAAARLAVTLFLGFYGARFLAYTTNLPDFILNSVALLFIQDIDDLCFAVLLSPDKQKAVRTIEAPLMQGLAMKGVAKIRPASEILSVVLIFSVVVAFSSLVEDFSEAYIIGAYGRICPGLSKNLTAGL